MTPPEKPPPAPPSAPDPLDEGARETLISEQDFVRPNILFYRETKKKLP